MTWTKDPNATLSYELDFTDWLGSDTLSSVAWSAPGLTVESFTNTTTSATIWLSGGTPGRVYPVRCRVTTAGGGIDDRTFTIEVTHR